jgi:uncharacterized RDD family membrane protein YckC
MEKAGFFSRFIALIIDGFVIGILAMIVSLIFGFIIGMTGQSDNGFMGFIAGTMSLLLIVIMFLFQFLYYGYFWSKDGQSIGKKLMGVKVVSQDGQPLSFLKAGLRGTIGYWISSLVFWLGFIWAAFDSNGETWHDKIFGTRVVKA